MIIVFTYECPFFWVKKDATFTDSILLSNDDIDISCLNRRGLHLNNKGGKLLFKNILNSLINC